ncbi:MAG TPA: EAL domain-containing protein [Geopsychrobacteraceae bacterium]|nr:EAL domain-containing protein [Geopsychrobacteraceae bacterium]
MFSYHRIKNLGLLVLVVIQLAMTVYAFRQLNQKEMDLAVLSEDLTHRFVTLNRIERTVVEAATLFNYDTIDVFLDSQSLSDVIEQAKTLSRLLTLRQQQADLAVRFQVLADIFDRLDFAVYLYAEAEKNFSSDREIIADIIERQLSGLFETLLSLQTDGFPEISQQDQVLLETLEEFAHISETLFLELEQTTIPQPGFIVLMLDSLSDDFLWLEQRNRKNNDQFEGGATSLVELQRNIELIKRNLPDIYEAWWRDPNMSNLKGDIERLSTVWDQVQVSLNVILLEENIRFNDERKEISRKANLSKIRFTVLALFGSVTAFVLAVVLSRILRQRLKRLTTVIKGYGEGNYDARLQITGNDDLSQLGLAFNSMAEEIQQKDKHLFGLIDDLVTSQTELKEAHGELERRVASRTSELSTANEKLVLMGKVFDHAKEGILVVTTDGTIIKVNPEFCRMTRFEKWTIVGKRPVIFHQNSSLFSENEIHHSLSRKGSWEGELVLNDSAGQMVPVRASVAQYFYDDGLLPAGYIAVLHDVRDLKEKEELIRYQAYHDALTDLPNRLLLTDRLEVAISRARRHDHKVGILFLDLDNFKKINDSFGHVFGDELLKKTADILLGIVRDVDTVSRIGGDEFIIVLNECRDRGQIYKLATRILQEISRSHLILNREVHTSVSIGIATYPENGNNVNDLLKNADIAMYSAKEHGKNTIQSFTRSMDDETQRRLAMEEAIWKALGEEEFELYYQPQVSSDGKRLCGVECLVRWNHPDRGLVAPDEFIPLCEETGQILQLGRWVLEEACRFAAWFQERYRLPGFRTYVNASAKQFNNKKFLETINHTLECYKLAPGLLGIEITETSMMVDVDYTRTVLESLDEKGIAVAIDDFGTGYSSLIQLKNFPIRTLKIDRSFISDLPGNSSDGKIVETIIAMASHLEIDTVAEGVETTEQQQFMQSLGCEKLQGYLFSKPLPRAEFEAYLQREHKVEPIGELGASGQD